MIPDPHCPLVPKHQSPYIAHHSTPPSRNGVAMKEGGGVELAGFFGS